MGGTNSYYTDEGLRRDIVDNLYKLYILLGCAVRLKAKPNDDIELVLRPFGFKLTRTPRRPGNGDLGLLRAAVASAPPCWARRGGARLPPPWRMSDVYPATVLQAFVDAVSTLVPHAIAIVIADLMRRRALNKGHGSSPPATSSAEVERTMSAWPGGAVSRDISALFCGASPRDRRRQPVSR